MSRSITVPSTGTSAHTNMNTQYALTRDQLNTFLQELDDPSFINNMTKLFTSPIENVISGYVYPFDVKSLSPVWSALSDSTIILGITTMTSRGLFLNPLSTPILDLGSAYIPKYFSTFADYAPYTHIELFLPYIGFVQLDNDDVVGKTISIKYAVDLSTGSCTAFVSTSVDGSDTIISVHNGNIGRQIQIAGGSGADLARNMVNFGLKTAGAAAGIAGGAVGMGFAESGGSPASIASAATMSAGFLASSTSNAIAAGQVRVHKGGANTPNNFMYAPQNAYVIYTRPIIAPPSSYNHTVGKPSGATATLSSLTGFTQVEAVHVEGLTTATAEEVDLVEKLLKQGVIL